MSDDLSAKRFHDEDAAREYLESIRWPDGPACPHCGGMERNSRLQGKSHRPGLMFCGDCRKQFSITVGTVFERSKVPLYKWVLASHLLCSSKKGMSSHQLHRMLGVTYKTAWFMTHRIREAMTTDQSVPMGSTGGAVEVDETYWGTSKPKGKTARGYDHKMKVLSLVERDGDKRTLHVPRVNAATLRPILKAQMSEKARLMTDKARVYTKVGREFAQHGVVVHSAKEYSRGDVATNSVESSFALLKRGLIGTFHHVDEQHLQRHVTKFDFRWDQRKVTDAERADALLV